MKIKLKMTQTGTIDCRLGSCQNQDFLSPKKSNKFSPLIKMENVIITIVRAINFTFFANTNGPRK